MKGLFIFQEPRNEHFKAFHQSNPLWKLFESFLLEHNHRQGEGGKWTESLNRFRIGTFTEDDLNILKGRVTKDEFLDSNAEHVMFKNKTVTDHNNKMLQSLKSPEVVLPAFKFPIKGYRYKVNPDTNNIDSTNFKDVLVLKTGARICVTFNIGTVDGLVNGTSGTVIDFIRNKKENVDAIIIDFDQPKFGEYQRKKYKYYLNPKKHGNGTPILRHELKYQASAKGFKTTVEPKILQFPMCLSWASTAHKMQVNFSTLLS